MRQSLVASFADARRKLLPRTFQRCLLDDRISSMLQTIQLLLQCDASTDQPRVLFAPGACIENNLARRFVVHCHPMLNLTS